MSLQLIYRGEVYNYTPSSQLYRQPRAVNWRFRASGETVNTSYVSIPVYQPPRAVNWRYQMAAEGHY